MRYKRGLVWLRQDLRIDDNTALFEASHDCKELVVIFVFDPHILNNLPENDKRLGFLLATLRHLGKQIRELGGRLSILYGNPIEVVPSFAKQESIDAIYTNRSYGQYGQQRDQQLQDRAHDYGAARLDFKDYLLVEPEEVKTMRVYTPYYRRRQAFLDEHEQQDYKLLQIERLQSWAIEPTHRNKVESKLSFAPCPLWRPEGRKERLSRDYSDYQEQRNRPDIDGSTKLSPYIRFGLVSIRQVYQELYAQRELSSSYITLIKELARREFWYHIAHHFPETYKQAYQQKKRHIDRSDDKDLFEAWKVGKTGYPIIDAGMRQLHQENRMHNRVRMIVASFLTKDCLIDWRRGEEHFADYLLDYDAQVNLGNRQRSASVGADPKPLRVFNPILQSRRYDPDAKYILTYLPELEGKPLAAIHDPLKHSLDYHTPIVDHYQASKKAKAAYAASKEQWRESKLLI